MTRKTSTSFYLSADAKEILKRLAADLGLSQAAVIEMALRKLDRGESQEDRGSQSSDQKKME